MNVFLSAALFLVLLGVGTVYAAPADRISKVESSVAKSAAGKAGEYSKDLLDAAQASISAAQAAARAGRDKESQQKLDLAELQLSAAEVKAAEKELIELLAVKRAELKKLEAQLEKYRQGEDK